MCRKKIHIKITSDKKRILRNERQRFIEIELKTIGWRSGFIDSIVSGSTHLVLEYALLQ